MQSTQIANDVKLTLENYFKSELKDVILFGSHLSKTNTKDSDYDILIILKTKADWKAQRIISDLCYEIDLKYNIITDTHILGEDELDTPRGKQPIFVNAIEKGYHA